MRAVLYRKYGGPEVLEVVQQHAMPQRKSGEVMVKVCSTSCNPLDVKTRDGSIPIAKYNKVRLLRHQAIWYGEGALKLTRRIQTQILGVDVAGTVEAADEHSKVCL